MQYYGSKLEGYKAENKAWQQPSGLKQQKPAGAMLLRLFLLQASMNTTIYNPLRYLISRPKINWYKGKLLQTNKDVRVFRNLITITTTIEALNLKSNNEKVIEKTPWLKAAFWSRLAELQYLESNTA